MNEFYEFEGMTYEVAPHRLEEFLKQHEGAVKVDGPGKTASLTAAPPLSQAATGSILGDGSLDLPEVTYKDVDLPETKAIEVFKKKYGGLGFTFEETGMWGQDWIPGDYVNITSPPDAEGNTVTKRFSVELGFSD